MRIALLLSLALSASGQVYFSVPPADSPSLAARGEFAVGVRTLDLVHRGQVDILKFDKATGKAPLYDRPLKVEVWYPATLGPGQEEKTVYRSPMPGAQNPAGGFTIDGKALRDAAPVQGRKFPLVVVSHGYPGSRTFMTWLTENIASKGYVVAAIDHTDSVFGEVRPFPSTLLNRSADQLFTIDEVTKLLPEMVDGSNVAIIGYSMGGYGALATAGAGYSNAGALGTIVPGHYMDDWLDGSQKFNSIDRRNIKALVAIAPWGEQPPTQAWSAQGLAGIAIPSLFIAGDHDDVADYERGIRPAFEQAIHSDRCMLVYENARHNTGGNPPPPGLTDFRTIQSFDEPVWRKDRITAINQHFITAFLDLYLKGDRSKREYLHPASMHSDDTWKGFQKRWALGLEMVCRDAAKN